MPDTVDDYTSILAYLDGSTLRWNAFTDLGVSVVVTYAFPEADELPDNATAFYGVDEFATFTGEQRAYARDALAELSAVSGVILVEVEGNEAMINLYSGRDTDGGGVSASGYAYYGQGTANGTYDSDLVMIYQDFTPGGFTYQVLLHELGHSMGLSHAHEGTHVLEDDHDHNENTVMTYNWSHHHQTEYGEYDALALSHLYGEAAAVSGFETRFNDDGMLVIKATSKDDALIGADIATKMMGRYGEDTLFGRETDDWLDGGRHADMLQAGHGEDVVYGQRGKDVIVGDMGNDYWGAADELRGGFGGDTIYGNGGDDFILGNQQSDVLYGQAGDDRIMGGQAGDDLYGGRGNDILTGGKGKDTFYFASTDGWDEDRITDFSASDDMIDVTGHGGVVEGNISFNQHGLDTHITSNAYGIRIVLEDFDHNDLSFDNFVMQDIA